MPLGSWFTGQWYGEAAMGSVTAVEITTAADLKAWAQPDATTSGIASVPLAKPTRLVNRPATVAAAASITQALPKGRARPTSTVRVNTLSQDDVTGAVLESLVEPGMTLKQALRIITAALAGKSTVDGDTITFRDVNDTADRITATVIASERTTVSTNA
jgi:hypothetical protein